MAVATTIYIKKRSGKTAGVRRSPVPRKLRRRVEPLLEENYAFMDSPIFRRKNIEDELFTFENGEPALPLTSWYQPTREECSVNGRLVDAAAHEGQRGAAHVPPLQLRQAAPQPAAAQRSSAKA